MHGNDDAVTLVPPVSGREHRRGPDLTLAGFPPSPLEASPPGLFAVGDVRSGSVERAAPAVGEGSVVVQAVPHPLAAPDAASAAP